MKWNCKYGYGSVETPGGGPGGGGFVAQCVSECVKGKEVEATVFTPIGGVSVFSPVPFTVTYSTMELEDPFYEAKKESLEGLLAFSSIGIAIGGGGSCTALKIGSAFGKSCSGQLGGSIGWDNFVGIGSVIDSSTRCCEKQ